MLISFLVLLLGMGLAACGAEETTEPRTIHTYIDWDFNELGEQDEIPSTASEGAGFEVVRVEAGESWVGSKNPEDWGAMYFGTPGSDGQETYLKNWAVTTVMFLPVENDGVENDGGIPILVGSAGRYDVAVQIAGADSVVNIWNASNTVNGPMATTDDPEKGSKVESLELLAGVEYTVTVLGRYEGMTDEGDEFFTVYVFIDDVLVLERSGLAYWPGGFGLRGWKSAIQYKNIMVTDFPNIAPDGNDYYND